MDLYYLKDRPSDESIIFHKASKYIWKNQRNWL